MPTLEINNLPFGPCAECLLHLETADDHVVPLPDSCHLVQLWCPHHSAGAVALVRSGEHPIRWTISVPVSEEVWPALVAAVAGREEQKSAGDVAGKPRKKWLSW